MANSTTPRTCRSVAACTTSTPARPCRRTRTAGVGRTRCGARPGTDSSACTHPSLRRARAPGSAPAARTPRTPAAAPCRNKRSTGSGCRRRRSGSRSVAPHRNARTAAQSASPDPRTQHRASVRRGRRCVPTVRCDRTVRTARAGARVDSSAGRSPASGPRGPGLGSVAAHRSVRTPSSCADRASSTPGTCPDRRPTAAPA